MATAFNSEVRVYKKVPLVKGGTEVLFLPASSALGVLPGLTATFTKYSYIRENEGAIQVDSPVGPLEGCNYVAFQNASHGGKWYFGFIDHLVYINDNNTQIEFTIDPFPTYFGDCGQYDDVYIVRNTSKTDIRGQHLQQDYLPSCVSSTVTEIANYQLTCDTVRSYFVCKSDDPAYVMGQIDGNSGIKIGGIGPAIIESIQQDGGQIIGGYMWPQGWLGNYASVAALGNLTVAPVAYAAGYQHNKIRSGVYNKVLLVGSQGSKSYEMEDFVNPQSITFRILRILIPSPAIFVYPLGYRGITDNITEGMMLKLPSIPIAANATYTNSQLFSDIASGVTATAVAAVAGGSIAPLAVSQAIAGTAARVGNQLAGLQFEGPRLIGSGEPILSAEKKIWVSACVSHPPTGDLTKIDDYFSYYGYAVGQMMDKGSINQDNEAYLQTGSDLFYGEHCEDLNARCAAGIKIRKTL